MRRVLITTSSFARYYTAPLDKITQTGMEYVLNPYGRRLTEDELITLIEQHRPTFVIAGTERMTSKAIEVMKPYVKVISRCGVGMDGIDLEYATKAGIRVINTPDAPTVAVAEMTLGIMLDLLRGISKADRRVRRGGFDKPMGFLMSGKVVGLIGCGRIGTYLASLLKAFGCRIIGYDAALKQHPTIKILSFREVIEQAEIISLHIPYTPDNHHLINKSVLSAMKSTTYLINAARGGLIDEKALYEALVNGRIAGAGLDCYENEPYCGKLSELDNVVLTPHIGSYAREARMKQEMDAVNNILIDAQ